MFFLGETPTLDIDLPFLLAIPLPKLLYMGLHNILYTNILHSLAFNENLTSNVMKYGNGPILMEFIGLTM